MCSAAHIEDREEHRTVALAVDNSLKSRDAVIGSDKRSGLGNYRAGDTGLAQPRNESSRIDTGHGHNVFYLHLLRLEQIDHPSEDRERGLRSNPVIVETGSVANIER